MQRLFVPVPDWLDQSKRISWERVPFPKPLSSEFLLDSFRTFYRMGMTDRQVVELSSLLCLLIANNKHHIMINKTMAELAQEKGWYCYGSEFCLGYSSFSDFLTSWVDIRVPKSDMRSSPGSCFWKMSEEWVRFFLDTEELELFREFVVATRNKFAQHCFGIPMTGSWDAYSIKVCRKYQEMFPKSVLPWRDGMLDGITYKFLAKHWRSKN